MLNKQFETNSHHNPQGIWMNNEMKQHCEVLGLEQLPSLEELKSAYKLLVKQWHPDRFHNDYELEKLAVQKTQRLNEAYRFLLKFIEKNDRTDLAGKKSTYHYTKNTRHNYSWQTYSKGFPDPAVTEFFVNSSHIVSAGYNKVRRILYLKFLGDEIFLYFDVPEFIFDHLLFAKSPGKYALKFIYNRFRHKKHVPIK